MALYSAAPITEAVLEIRVEPPAQADVSVLDSLTEAAKSEFPKRVPMQFLEMGIAQEAGQRIQQRLSQSVVGYRLAKEDDSRVLQVRLDGFAYSHMAPYSNWARFRDEARILWGRYRSLRPTAKLVRCALRYINRIDIPFQEIEAYDYFSLYPKVPESLPQQHIIGMSLSLQMPQHDLECVANISQALAEPVKPNSISFILDIDIFRLGIEGWDDDSVWDYLESLRTRKNEIFEACITDKARKLIGS
jgi:uncharacterized protein (TIGR04255 family)